MPSKKTIVSRDYKNEWIGKEQQSTDAIELLSRSAAARWWRISRAARRATRPLCILAAVLAAAPVQAHVSPLPDGVTAIDNTPGGAATRERDPSITFITDSDTIFAGLEDLVLLLERDTPGNRLTVTVKFEQEEEWLADRSYEVTFPAGDSIASLLILNTDFKDGVTRSGDLTATLDDVSGYETANAKATIRVISSDGPVVTYSLSQASYSFEENVGRARAELVARMAPGMPRGVTVGAFLGTRGTETGGSQFTATPGEDYEPVGGAVLMVESKYELEGGRWVGRTGVIVLLLDDDVHEGTETFELNLRPIDRQSASAAQLLNPDGSSCGSRCRHLMHITDAEDRPGRVGIELAQSSVAENGGTVGYTITAVTGSDRQPGAGFSMAVPVATVEGSAVDEVDFVAISNTMTFARGDFRRTEFTAGSGDYRWVATKQSAIALVDDEEVEEEERFAITLSAPPASSGFILGTASAEVAITNEDRWGFAVGVSPESIREGDEVEVTVTLRLVDKTGRLSADGHCIAAFPVTAAIALGGSASENSDYTVTSGDLSSVRLAGCQPSTRVTLRMRALTDDESEDAEQVTFSPVLVDTRLLDPDPALHQAASLGIENVAGPPRVSFSGSSSTFAETARDAVVELLARAEPGASGGTAVTFSVSSRSRTATSGADFRPVGEVVTLQEHDYTLESGAWVARHRLPVTLLDDRVREGTEMLDLILEHAPGQTSGLRLSNPDGQRCGDPCTHPVYVTDDEDIPELDVSIDAEEIGEEGQTSVTVTISITNGTTFSTDQDFTLTFGGSATEGVDYVANPPDADAGTPGHQVTLPAGATSVVVTITAIDDDDEDPGETFELQVTLGDETVGDVSVPIRNRPAGPEVEITFEGVQPPRDPQTAGVATGPFTTRFTFSERVEGFSQDDIRWSTHSLTTVDTTNIAVLVWDYAVIREGLEYTARMMPGQNGRLWINVFPGAARSVAKGGGNQLGGNSLWVDLPADRMMVEPDRLTVYEGDDDGAEFLVLLTSEPTGPVTVTVTGTDGTALAVDRPTVGFNLPYWNGGRGITVTAGSDSNNADETVTLTVRSSGGGYDGQTETVVVTVRDTGANASSASDGEDDLLALVEQVTPQQAAAALFGQEGLSAAQLDALDLLGNRNGGYDLGDLLSWIARCRRMEASCSSPVSVVGAGALPASPATSAPGRRGRGRRRRPARRGLGRRERGHPGRDDVRAVHTPGSAPNDGAGGGMTVGAQSDGDETALNVRRVFRRAPFTRWLRLALLATVPVTWGCGLGDDIVDPEVPGNDRAAPQPGSLQVRLTMPFGARTAGAMLVVEGPGIESLHAPGLELIELDESSATRREVIVTGDLTTGPVLQVRVAHVGNYAGYRVRLLQVAGADYAPRDVAEYRVVISR